jgi:hypothetical protein
MKAHAVLGVMLASALGCSEAPKLVPVTGVVKLNGKPLAGATVAFSPVAKAGEINAGDGSAGKTNDSGEFNLSTSHGVPGAIVGKHKVRIFALSPQVGSGEPPRSGWPLVNKVPARYNEESTLTFEVTAPGPNKADFDLTSP